MASFARPPCDELAIRAGSCNGSTTKNGPWILAATILGSSMAFIDGTVVNVALAALQSALGATWRRSNGWWNRTRCFLRAAPHRRIFRRFVRAPKIFTTGVIIFSAASASCGTAPSIGQLIVARGAKASAAHSLFPGAWLSSARIFRRTSAAARSERGRASRSITAAIGPVLGGYFVEHGSWRWVFFINIPVGLAVVALTLWKVPESWGR